LNPCGKYYYVSLEEASARMARMKPQYPGKVLNVYFCTRCEGFHVGHTLPVTMAASA